MVGPAQTVDVGWGAVVATVVAPGLVAGLICAPFLAAERLRALFRALPPRDGLVGSYIGAALLGAVPFYAVTITGLSAAERGALGGGPAPLSNALLGAIPVLLVGYAAGVPAVAGGALPLLGYDWDPTGYGPGT